jgi:diguanylate cyclase (GGDEF)-like protein
MTSPRLKVLLVTTAASAVGEQDALAGAAESAAIDLAPVSSMADALAALDRDRFDSALVEVTATDEADRALAPLTRLRDHASEMPIIALIRGGDDALGVRALKAGAQDALALSLVTGDLLLRAIRYAIERHQLQMALCAMSLVDDLTALYNRRGFLTLARQQLRMADRMGRRVCLLFVDLDGLKWINDTHGHLVGDQALIDTGDLLRETFRDSDIIARFGGDEFVVLALENQDSSIETWMRRLRDRLDEINALPGRRCPLSVSTGVSYYEPAFPTPLEELLARADNLMYAEKNRKRQALAGPLRPPRSAPPPTELVPAPRAD